MKNQSLAERVAALNWYHTIDLGNGVVTPGNPFDQIWAMIEAQMRSIDLTGKRVLDIGCWDGKFSFLAESLGAQVVATDFVVGRWGGRETFQLAAEALGSQAEYLPDVDVCKLSERFPRGSFDVVLFMGVLYHLRYPMLALAQIRHMLKPGGFLICETHAVLNQRDSLIYFNYRDPREKDPSNWAFPTTLAHRKMVASCYFDVRNQEILPLDRAGTLRQSARWLLGRARPIPARSVILAQAVNQEDSGHIYPDNLLAEYDPRYTFSAS